MRGIGNGISDFNHHEADYSVSCHSLARAFYYFAIPDSAANKDVDAGVAIEEAEVLPESYSIGDLYPNPFKPCVKIRAAAEPTDPLPVVRIFNIKGELVRTIQAKNSVVEWNGRDQFRKPVSAGVYLIKIDLGKKSQVRKAILRK